MGFRYEKVAAALLLLNLVILFLTGFSLPRPLLYFVNFAAILSLLLFKAVHKQSISREEATVAAVIIVATTFLFRISGYVAYVNSGDDHGMFLNRAQDVVQTGEKPITQGIYNSAPFIYIIKSLGDIMAGLWILDTRFITIAFVAILPVLVGLLAFDMTDRRDCFIVAAVLTAPYQLFMRNATILEPESLALPLFAAVFFLLFKSMRTNSRRYYMLFVVFTIMTSAVHFLYMMITLISVFLTVCILYVLRFTHVVKTGRPRGEVLYAISLAIIGLVVSFRLFWEQGARAVGFVVVGSSSVQIPIGDPLSIFLPSSQGQLGQNTGSSGTLTGRIANFFQIMVFGVAGALGFLHAAYTDTDRFQFSIAALLSLGIITPLFLIKGTRPKFRIYYFVSIFLIGFAAYAVRNVSRARAGRFVVVILFFAGAVIGPISPVGNNVDPRFGGQSVGTTPTEYEQIRHIDAYLEGDALLPVRNDRILIGHRTIVAARGAETNTDLYAVAGGSCGSNATVYDGTDIRLCEG